MLISANASTTDQTIAVYLITSLCVFVALLLVVQTHGILRTFLDTYDTLYIQRYCIWTPCTANEVAAK